MNEIFKILFIGIIAVLITFTIYTPSIYLANIPYNKYQKKLKNLDLNNEEDRKEAQRINRRQGLIMCFPFITTLIIMILIAHFLELKLQ
ncbi:MAG: hypothetical protein C0412_15020 [Flavobacterium sp.]|nr:hypothetical protein [Flavobacterium sp.]